MKQKIVALALASLLLAGCSSPESSSTSAPDTSAPSTSLPGSSSSTPPSSSVVNIEPTVVGDIHHYTIGSVGENVIVTATLNLKGKALTKITIDGTELVADMDYTINTENTKITILGSYLNVGVTTLGAHPVVITTEGGTATFNIDVITDPCQEGSTIVCTTKEGINFQATENYKPTAVIADAPELMITEINADTENYTYIKVYNNTASEYNLKNHKLMFMNPTDSARLLDDGQVWQSFSSYSTAFIVDDYKIPAYETGLIWSLSAATWFVPATTGARTVSEIESRSKLVFGKEGALSVDSFRENFNLSANSLVFPVRTSYMYDNSSTKGVTADHGTVVSRVSTATGTAFWSGFNTKFVRGLQIQKFDPENKTAIDATHPEYENGARYIRYEHGVLNAEKDVLNADGSIDHSKIVLTGPEATTRESINAIYMRGIYLNEEGTRVLPEKFIGFDYYDNTTAKLPTLKLASLPLYESGAVKTIVQANIYPKAYEGMAETTFITSGAVDENKHGNGNGIQYSLPEAGSFVMKYLPSFGQKSLWEARIPVEHADRAVIATWAAENEDYGKSAIKVAPEGYNGTGAATNFAKGNAWFNLKTSK